jgi:PAS domain S-box-containing protein
MAKRFNRLIGQETKKAEQLSLVDLVGSLPYGLFWKGLDQKYLGCNQIFADDVGLADPEDVIGCVDTDILPAKLASDLLQATNTILLGETQTQLIGFNKLPHGIASKTEMALLVCPLTDSENTLIGISGSYEANSVVSAEEHLRNESEEKYRTLFDHAEECMWLITGDLFTNANPAAVRILRYDTVEELVNTHPSQLSPEYQPDGQSSFEKAGRMMALARSNGRHRFEWMHKKKDGEVFPVEVTLTRAPIEGRDLLLCMWRDITEQKNAEKSLREARDTAESMAQMKTEFLSNMSHEIRTPMSGILGMLSLIPSDELSQSNRTYLENAHASATALLNIINDVLDLSRLEAGRMAVSLEPVDLRFLTKQIVDLVGSNTSDGSVVLRAVVADNVPEIVTLDGNHLRQILLNLVGNAQKFTTEGEIVLAVRLQDEGAGSKCLRVSVKDTGIGIPEDEIQTIFTRFHQVDGTASRKHQGTGLGLAICSELMSLHGGEIAVDSTFGEGSCFWFTMPFDLADTNDLASNTEDLQNSSGKSLSETTSETFDQTHVLVAEDNQINQLVISSWLDSQDVSYEIFDDGQLLLSHLLEHETESKIADLILMDIQMPNLDGVEATQAIRKLENKAIANLPILALTAHAMAGQKNGYLQAGMDGYVSKPINFDALNREMQRVLRKRLHGSA